MLLNSDYITPAELTGYVRASEADRVENRFTLAQWLPYNPIDDLDFRFSKGGEGLIEAASYRSYDTEADIGSRPGLMRVQGELPPISRKIRLGEYDRLKARKAGNDEVVDSILPDADRMVKSIAARLELARGDALVNGKVTINERGVRLEADFGRRAQHSVAPSTLWSDPASTPLTDLLNWKDVYSDTNSEEPGAILTSTEVMQWLLRNEEIRQLAANWQGTPNIVSAAVFASILEAHGLPQIITYNAKVNVNKTAHRIIPANKVVLLPAPGEPNTPGSTDLGATLLGTTAESLSSKYGIESGEEPGIVAGVYEDDDPIALWTKASAIGMPVLANPDLSMVGTVAS